MFRFTYHPTIEQATRDSGFIQRIELYEDQRRLGRALWHLPTHADGVAQIIELMIDESQQRRGHGGRLLNEVLRQARLLATTRGTTLRRVWIMVEQKSQLRARAFLTRHGFHHTSTASNLLRDQDLLLYSKAFD
jgi:ribosomal protein S18 acetylase RimI-like enzyme